MLLPGASCPPAPPTIPIETPEKNLQMFKQALETDDYGTAYYCLSDNTRSRYKFSHFKLMMERTIFGVLIKSIIINWETVSVKYYSEKDDKDKPVQKAKVVLQHWKYQDCRKEFIFVYELVDEETKEFGWHVDFTLAGVLGIPQEDEDRLFPVPPKEEPTEENKD